MRTTGKHSKPLMRPGVLLKTKGYSRLLSIFALLVLASLLLGSLGHHLFHHHDHIEIHDCAVCLEISRFSSVLSRLFLISTLFSLLFSLCLKTRVILGRALVLPPVTPQALSVRLNN